MCSPRVALACRLGYALVGILIGLSVGAVFILTFHNPPAAYWGLTSAVFALLSLLLFIYLHIAKHVHKRPPSSLLLLLTGILSALGVGVGLGGVATYLGLGISNTIGGDDRPLFETEYIVCVWSFMTFKWAITSYVYIIRGLEYRGRRLRHSDSNEEEEEEREEEIGEGRGVTYSKLKEQEEEEEEEKDGEPSFITGEGSCHDYEDVPAIMSASGQS